MCEYEGDTTGIEKYMIQKMEQKQGRCTNHDEMNCAYCIGDGMECCDDERHR